MTVDEALRAATAALAHISDTPRLDAEMLMAHALGRTRDALLLGDRRGPAPVAFDAFVARRQAREPVAYVTGTREIGRASCRERVSDTV